ncbi:MAG: hypothetical protein NVS4B10_13660 [Myxococcales bacterium]
MPIPALPDTRVTLRAAVDEGLIQILYVSREHVRAGQFLTFLADRLQGMQAARVVLDAAAQMITEHTAIDEFRHVLYKLVLRFKTLGITSLLTLEAPSLFSVERVTEQGLSPVADNLLMLRYRDVEGRLTPTLTIVKTRGSEHDRGTFALVVDDGGLRIGTDGAPLTSPATSRGSKKTPRSRSGRSRR